MKNKSSDRLRFVLAPLIAFFIFSADFLIKTYLRTNFAGESFPLVGNFIYITLVFNTGTAFGFLQGRSELLVYFTLALMLVFVFIYRSEKKKKLLFRVGAGLILGGAASNLVDRLMLGAVVDYLDLRFWPVFNLSDACITIGAALLIIDSFQRKQRPLLNQDTTPKC